jgi:drug/metabolite transporter (DMT)-like permease
MTIAALAYLLLPTVWKGLKTISFAHFSTFFGIGIIVCAHWLTFYGSIKLGNSVSITLACLGSASFFAAVLEPVILKSNFIKKDILTGLVVIVGVFFISFSLPKNINTNISYPAAIGTGLISAALAALFTTLNKKNIHISNPLTISAIEMFAGAALLSIVVPLTTKNTIWYPQMNIDKFDSQHLQNGALDLVWVLFLTILCTNLTFYLGTYSLKYLSAFTANLTVNLEPIYGIILGILIFHENNELNMKFYIGTIIIIGAIFINPILSLKKNEN